MIKKDKPSNKTQHRTVDMFVKMSPGVPDG